MSDKTIVPQDDPTHERSTEELRWPRPHHLDGVGRNVSFRRYQAGTWSVVEASGEVDLDVAPVLREMLVDAPSVNLAVDLHGVTFMDSSGLSALTAAWSKVEPAGGTVRLVGAADRVVKLLAITQVDRLMETYATLEEATR